MSVTFLKKNRLVSNICEKHMDLSRAARLMKSSCVSGTSQCFSRFSCWIHLFPIFFDMFSIFYLGPPCEFNLNWFRVKPQLLKSSLTLNGLVSETGEETPWPLHRKIITKFLEKTSVIAGYLADWPRFYPGWWFGTFFIFPYIGNNHPNWLIFFRGVAQPPTSGWLAKILPILPALAPWISSTKSRERAAVVLSAGFVGDILLTCNEGLVTATFLRCWGKLA